MTWTNLELTWTNPELTWTNLELTWTNLDLTWTNLELTWTNLELTWTNLELTWTNPELTWTNHELTWTNLELTWTNSLVSLCFWGFVVFSKNSLFQISRYCRVFKEWAKFILFYILKQVYSYDQKIGRGIICHPLCHIKS